MAAGSPGERETTNARSQAAAPNIADDANPDLAHRVHETETVVGSRDDDSTSSDVPRPVGAAADSVANLDEFKGVLIELGVVSADELETFEVDPSSGVLGLARASVKAGPLTPYQSAAIYQKKSRGLLIGNYIILDKLGVGGMGMVFKARHRKLGRVGALKILPPSFARDKNAVMRFRREVEAAGRLKHPNVVAALDADEDRGVHFLVMDYVAGSDLDRVVQQRGPMPVVQAIDCIIQAARGLEAAHAQGIVHRDIKPGNLMLDTAETIRVLDLGLARIVDASNPFSKTAAGRLTESGMYMGTIDYMAPEQAEDSHRVDHRADIYSLGCTLYYLLTGKEPFPAETVLKRLLAHMERPAPSIRALRPTVSPAVDAAYQKMMAKRPDDCAASMTEVIALLESCKASGAEVQAAASAGEAPKSRPELKVFNEPTLKRAGSPKTKGDPSIFAVGDLGERPLVEHDLHFEDLVMDVRPEARPTVLPPVPRPAPAKAQPLKRQGTRRSGGRPNRTRMVLAGLGGLAVLGAAFVRFVLFPGPPPDTELSARIAAVKSAGDRSTQRGKENPPPDDTPEAKLRKADSEIKLTEADRNSHAADSKEVLSNTRGPTSTMKNAGGTRAASTAAETAQSRVESYVETTRFVGHQHQWVESIRVLPDGKRLLTSGFDGTARVWDTATGREILRLWHPNGVRQTAVVPGTSGLRAVTACYDGVVRLWDLETGKLVKPLITLSAPVSTVAVSPDGHYVLSGSDDNTLRLMDLEKGVTAHRFDGAGAPFLSATFSPDSRRFLAGDRIAGVWLRDLGGSRSMQSLTGKRDNIIWHLWGIAFAGDSRHAVSDTFDSFLTYWDLDAKSAIRQQRPGDYQVRDIVIDADGRHVFIALQRGVQRGTTDGAIGFWDVATNDPVRLGARGPAHVGIALLPDGGIATADMDGFARIWRPLPALRAARSLASAGKRREALAEYGKALSERPDDPALLIERGRLLAESGQAIAFGEGLSPDADFTHAAQLAPDNPQLFLNGGWWVAGPYPPDLKVREPIESERAPDPSKPAPPVAGAPARWRWVPIEMLGRVDLGRVYHSDNVAAYALSVVYATARKDVVLLIATDDAARVWLNGRLVLESPGYTELPDGHAVLGVLQPGRNTLLARVANGSGPLSFQLRISDSPAAFSRAFAQAKKWNQAIEAYNKVMALEPDNRDVLLHDAAGIAFAQLGRWKSAKEAFERALSIDPAAEWIQGKLLRCYIALNDVAPYRRLCQQWIARAGKDRDLWAVNNAVWLAALLPGALSNYEEAKKSAKRLVDGNKVDPAFFRTYGAILYRARQDASAIRQLEQAIEAQSRKGSAFDWVFLAMARHRLKQPGDKEALAQAKALAGTAPYDWTLRVDVNHLLDEAQWELDH